METKRKKIKVTTPAEIKRPVYPVSADGRLADLGEMSRLLSFSRNVLVRGSERGDFPPLYFETKAIKQWIKDHTIVPVEKKKRSR